MMTCRRCARSYDEREFVHVCTPEDPVDTVDRLAALEDRVAELERGRDALIARVDHLDESVATLKEEPCPKDETTNDAESTGADASLKVHGGMSSPKSSDGCESRNSSDCSVSGGTTPSVPASRSTGGIAGTGSSDPLGRRSDPCPKDETRNGASADTRNEATPSTLNLTASPVSSEIPSGRTAQATDPLAEAIRAYREARKFSLDPDEMTAEGYPDTARAIRHADRLSREAEKAMKERVEWRAEVEEYSQAADHWKARAEKAEARIGVLERLMASMDEESDRTQAERDAAVSQLADVAASSKAEIDALKAEVDAQETLLLNLVQDLVSILGSGGADLRDAVRAVVQERAVERKSVDEMRAWWANGPSSLFTIAWCRAVDERRKKEAT